MQRVGTAAGVALIGVLLAAPADAGVTGATSRVSLGAAGQQSASASFSSSQVVSAHGRFVVFVSDGPGLVPGDHNGLADVFVRDRLAGTTERVSVGQDGSRGHGQGSGDENGPGLTPSGRYVVFSSTAPDLVRGDTNGATDVFLRDRVSGRTRRASLADGGGQIGGHSLGGAVSADGHLVAFQSRATDVVPGDADADGGFFLHDLRSRRTRFVAHSGYTPAFSADGRYLAFSSADPALLPAPSTNTFEVYVLDLQSGRTRRVAAGLAGAAPTGDSIQPSISRDGRLVAFVSAADNLVAGDTNRDLDVFVRDMHTGRTRRVSLGAGGRQATQDSTSSSISANGRFVAFTSFASNLVPGDTNLRIDAFVHDLQMGLTRRISVGPGGRQADGGSFAVSLSADGRHAVFPSDAPNLVPGDTNDTTDVFAHDDASGGG